MLNILNYVPSAIQLDYEENRDEVQTDQWTGDIERWAPPRSKRLLHFWVLFQLMGTLRCNIAQYTGRHGTKVEAMLLLIA